MRRSTVQHDYAKRSLSCYYHLRLLDVSDIGQWDAIFEAASKIAKLTVHDVLDFHFVWD